MKKFFVQSLETGLYLGEKFDRYQGPQWMKRGKCWSTLEEVKQHLTNLREKKIPVSPFWEIVIKEKKHEERFPAVGILT